MTEPTDKTPRPSAEEQPYVDDPVSRVWVALIVSVFGLIFVFALLFGHGGLLIPAPPPSPSPSPTPGPPAPAQPSPSPSVPPAPSVTPSPSVSPAASVSPAPSVSSTPVS